MKNIAERQKRKNKWHFVIVTQANNGLSRTCTHHYVSCCKPKWRNIGAGTKHFPTN